MRRAAALAAALLGVLAVVGAPLPTAAEEELRPVGALPLEASEAIVVDAVAERLLGVAGGITPLTVKAYDPGRIALTATREFAGFRPQQGVTGSPRVVAMDDSARRLYVIGYDHDNDTVVESEMKNGVDPRLLSFDTDTLEMTDNLPFAAFPPGVRTLGLDVVAPGVALALGQVAAEATLPFLPPLGAPRSGGLLVAQVDLATGEAVWGPNLVRGCQSGITTLKPAESALAGGGIFVGCSTISVQGIPAPGVPAVIEIDVADPTRQTVHFMPGSYTLGESVWDREAQRLILVGAAFARPAQAAWVFDLAESSFVGQVAAGDSNVMGAGVNTANGRLYVTTEDGVLVTTDRGVEIPQATPVEMRPAHGAVTAIPFNGRVVIPTRDASENLVYTVYEDAIPESAFPPSELVDFHALDNLRSEFPQFSGAAKAFGLRLREIGGLNAVLLNLRPQQQTNYWAPVQQETGLRDGDRDIHFSRVTDARLGGDEATARAVSVGADTTTEEDYKLLAGKVDGEEPPDGDEDDPPLPREWPFATAQCGNFGGGKDIAAAEGTTTVCDHGAKRTAASATHGGVGLEDLIRVGATRSDVELRLDPKQGLVVVAHAEARDVEIGADVSIGYVASDAVAGAFGKPGTANGGYTRTIRNVRAGDFECHADCNPAEVAAALTRELGAQLRVELPRHEKVETKGGAHGHAFRDRWQHQQDVVLNNQDPTETQVPALRLMAVADNAVASRVIVELAATRADATYVPFGLPPPPPPFKIPPPPEVIIDIDPGVIEVPPPPPPPSVAGFREEIIREPARALKLLFGGGPRWFALWALMAVPVFLLSRRRHLVRVLRSRG